MSQFGRRHPGNRDLARCATCRAWWSVDRDGQRCPCGGELVKVDMQTHMANVPLATKETK